MSPAFSRTILLIGLLSLLVGFLLQFRALSRHRAAGTPLFPAVSPRHWTPAWRTRPWFQNDKGFDLFMTGDSLIGIGAAAALIYFAVTIFCGR
jgi:hypothetical protein